MNDRDRVEPSQEALPAAPVAQGDSPLPLTSRRHFARAGAAAPVLLGSLLSKPALGAQAYNCTISGQMSGNASPRPGAVTCSTIGRSPTYWKNNTSSWPAGTLAGNLPDGSCDFGGKKGTLFGGFASGTGILADAFRYKVESGSCNVYDLRGAGFGACTQKATFLQVLSTPGKLNDTMGYALGRALVATILNALKVGADYPVSVAQAIKMFNAVAPAGGRYQVNASVSWSDQQVLNYFQSLYT